MRVVVLVSTLLLLAACDSTGSMPEAGEPERIYTKDVERVASNDFEYALIEAAEAEYPLRDSVLAAVTESHRNLVPEDKYWYYAGFGGIRFAYAITLDAVEFYSSVIDSLATSQIEPHTTVAEFEYEATVRFAESYTFDPENHTPYADTASEIASYKQIYLVDMSFRWFDSAESGSCRSIKKKRIVVFDQSGNLLRVYLDGRANTAVC